MGIVHIVMFQFKADTSQDKIKELCNGMLGLKDKCVSKESQKPYIKSLTGGKDTSPEGMQHGIQYAFVVEFENDADREYYLYHDPAHVTFKEQGLPCLEKGIVVDYTPGAF